MTTTITGSTTNVSLKERKLTILSGILGFDSFTKFSLSAYDPNTPFYWLTSDEDPNLAFIVMEPKYVLENYEFDISEDFAKSLELTSPDDAFILVLLSIPDDPSEMTANLLGPLVFNRHSNTGKQIVLELSNYPIQFPLFPEGLPQS